MPTLIMSRLLKRQITGKLFWRINVLAFQPRLQNNFPETKSLPEPSFVLREHYSCKLGEINQGLLKINLQLRFCCYLKLFSASAAANIISSPFAFGPHTLYLEECQFAFGGSLQETTKVKNGKTKTPLTKGNKFSETKALAIFYPDCY